MRIFAMGALVLVGCHGAAGETGDSSVDSDTDVQDTDVTGSYADTIQPIWDGYCNRCHQRGIPNLTSDAGSGPLLTGTAQCGPGGAVVHYVVPGDPLNSFLMWKLAGASSLTITDDVVGGCTATMPQGEIQNPAPLNELDPDAVTVIRNWIIAGAHG